jgi:hypothetical protein
VEFGVETKKVGRTSITVSCLVRNKATKKIICYADDFVFFRVDPQSKRPVGHDKTMEQLVTQIKQDIRSLNIKKQTILVTPTLSNRSFRLLTFLCSDGAMPTFIKRNPFRMTYFLPSAAKSR